MQNEKLKKVYRLFGKYRRYFCAAVLFVILVVILVKCTGSQKDQKETQNGTQGVTQTTEYQEIGKLQKDADPELVTLMENYYAAYAGGDTDSLEMIAQPLSDNEKSYITTFLSIMRIIRTSPVIPQRGQPMILIWYLYAMI